MKIFQLSALDELSKVVAEVLDEAREVERQHDDRAVVLALHGDLGAGKTTFTQNLAKTLGVNDTVTSPTFVVMKGYETTDKQFKQLVHIDAYRIEDVDEMRVLHFAEILKEKQTIIVIEWAERIAALLPPTTVHLTFEITGEDRIITCSDGN